jgi:hypothetical protein
MVTVAAAMRKRQVSESRRYQPGAVLETHAGAKVTLIEIISSGRWRAKYVCPDCPPDKSIHDVKIYTGASAFANFSGLCPPHAQIRRRKLIGRQPHPSGAIILWDERPVGSRDVTFICREHDIGEHRANIDFFQLQRHRLCPQRFGEWSGACKLCRRRLRGTAFKVNGVVIRRDPNRATEGYGWVLCPDGISPNCEKERYVKLDIGSYLSGRHTGRCKPCSNFRRAESLPEELPLTHAPILGRYKDMVKVQCLYPVSENERGICGVVHEVNVDRLRSTWEYATGFCREHHIARPRGNLEAYKQAIQSLLARHPKGNGQKNGGAGKRGRKLGNQQWDRKEFKGHLDVVLDKLLSRAKSLKSANLLSIKNALEGEGVYFDTSTLSRKIKDSTHMPLDEYKLDFVRRKAIAIKS